MLHDNGSNGAPNVNTSAAQTFTITVTTVNDAPSFTKGADQTVLEDTGAQSVAGWATAISPWRPADEAVQTLTFTVTGNTNAGLFSAGPSVSAKRHPDLHPGGQRQWHGHHHPDASDNGGTANGGVDTSPAQTFTITVTAVNDVPSFTKGADQTVLEDAGAQSVAGWATGDCRRRSTKWRRRLTFIVTGNTNADAVQCRAQRQRHRHLDLHAGGQCQRHGHHHPDAAG